MTLGQKIKKARTEANLTQKELAEQLSVTFQTVSKWESNITEPDLATLRAIAKALNVALEYLVSEEEAEPSEEAVAPVLAPSNKQIGTCPECGCAIHEEDPVHTVERRNQRGFLEAVKICDACYRKHGSDASPSTDESSVKRKTFYKGSGPFHKITERDDKKPLIWGIFIGAIVMVIALIACIIKYEEVGLGWTIGGPLLAGYAVMATIYCIFTMSYVSDVFMTVASWSVRFPGLIFSWSLDGFLWLIAMKLLFFVLGIFISIAVFLLALSIAGALSVVSFIPLLIYNKTHYRKES